MGISLANLTDYDASARYYVRALALNPRASAGEGAPMYRARRERGAGRVGLQITGGSPSKAAGRRSSRPAVLLPPCHTHTPPTPACPRSVELPAHLADMCGTAGLAARRRCGGLAGAAKGAAAGVSHWCPTAGI